MTTLWELINGYRITQALCAVSSLGIPDELAEASRSSAELAALSGADETALRRLLRALAAAGVLHESEDDRFTLTPTGHALRRDVPDSAADWLAFVGSPQHWETWGHLVDSVRSGRTAFGTLHGSDVWSYRAEHPEEGAIFDAAMAAHTRRTNTAILDAFDFGRFDLVVDVGGGTGSFLAAALAAHPHLRGVVFDRPQLVAGAEQLLRERGVADRSSATGGDFFHEVPAGGDAYLLKSVLHDWLDEEATTILRTCRAAVRPGATLLVVERVLGPANEALDTKLSDLNMLVMTGGKERSLEEFATLLEAAGFTLLAQTPTPSGFSILEATPTAA